MAESFPEDVEIASAWLLQDAAKVKSRGEQLSQPGFETQAWYPATVPGTLLTSLVNNGVYPEPLYGENNRPDKIPESLCHTSYWYRTDFLVPAAYREKQIWLNFDGINYTAQVWVNGKNLGSIQGAFARGMFNITSLAQPGQRAGLAVLISPQPNPGEPHEHTLADGMGPNGGVSAMDGPTFLCSIGWDWIPAIRDRNSGIWQKVFLSCSGPLLLKDPLVTTELALPSLDAADCFVQVRVENTSDTPQPAKVIGSLGDVSFSQDLQVAPRSSALLSFHAKDFPQLHLKNPKLWWPNGFGPQNLYQLKLQVLAANQLSDQTSFKFGVRKISYSVADSENLTLSVNGVRVFCKGGNWGMDEAMKRIPRQRLQAQIRMHQLANYTMLRNWVGQSTSRDFYELCDEYGLLIWDEFFQPNPCDGPNPANLDLYLANCREKILRFRNHPSIALWCGRNEGHPPKEIDEALQKLMAELEPTRAYQASSTDGRGVESGGPYHWRPPHQYYEGNEPFKTEIGSVSVPTLESIQGMLPEKDWQAITDAWAQHDLARGAQKGDEYPLMLAQRYGALANLADFARKGQMANYEAFRAMYEGRLSKLFQPYSGAITWMSNPAQPSFVWQLYHHDLEPNAALFAARKACEPQHVQWNEKEGGVEIINHLPAALNAKVTLTFYNLDGSPAGQHNWQIEAAPSAVTRLGHPGLPATLSEIYFIKLEMRNSEGQLVSNNFYWQNKAQADNLQALNRLQIINLEAEVQRKDQNGNCLLSVNLHNPGPQPALMVHLQLRRAASQNRVLPAYYSDNYLSLLPGETHSVQVEASLSGLRSEKPLLVVDGWNVAVKPFHSAQAELSLNQNAQVSLWPQTGLPFAK